MGELCTYDESNWRDFPFSYTYSNGSSAKTGYVVDGVCVFDGACCCDLNPKVEQESQVWYIPLICFVVFMILFKRLRAYFRPAGSENGAQMETQRPFQFMMQGKPRWYGIALVIVVFIGIMATVTESVIMPASIQDRLSPSERAAQLAMSSFLTPIKEIFSFIEDTMSVEVGYALSARDFSKLNTLLNISVLGGVVLGLLAFCVMLALAFIDVVAEFLLNPSSASNHQLIDAGCSLIPNSSDLLESARTYWLITTAAWIPSFAGSAFQGFFVGTGQLLQYYIPLIALGAVPVVVWFSLLGARSDGDTDLEPLEILGVAYGVADWANFLYFFGILAASSGLRREYRLRPLLCGSWGGDAGGGGEQGAGTGGGGGLSSIFRGDTFRTLVRHGLDLLLVDLAVQLSITVTIYVAADRSFSNAYKIAAVQAAYWTFGPAYIVGTSLMIKTLGSRMIAQGSHRSFIGLFVFFVGLCIALGIGAFVTAFVKREVVAYDFGQSACIYASKRECAGLYGDIFKKDDSLAQVFEAFGPTVFLQMLFYGMRAGLAICYDFDYLAKVACTTFVVVYVPTILVVRYAIDTATGYYVAMYLPHFVMIVVFGRRMWRHITALLNGEPGPWTEQMNRMNGPPNDLDAALLDGKDADDVQGDRKGSVNIAMDEGI